MKLAKSFGYVKIASRSLFTMPGKDRMPKIGMTIEKFILDKEDTVLLIVDIQDKLAAVVKEKDKVVRNNQHLIALAKMIGMPVLLTEQYPRGLGATVPEIREVLPFYRPLEKMTFDCCGQPAFLEALKEHNTRNVILTGMETHICVLQTCIGLLKGGINVHVAQDAVCSRTRENWAAGIEFMREAGAVITCTETVLFQLLKVAGTAEFKTISQRIK
jgi:nicotinamidase-related amidase